MVVLFAGVDGQETHQDGSERVDVVGWRDVEHELVEEEREVHERHLNEKTITNTTNHIT